MDLISRLARAAVLLGAIWLAGCQSLPSNLPADTPPPPQEATQPPEPAPSEKLASRPSPEAVERALARHIAQRYRTAHTHAMRVVRAAGDASKLTGVPRTLILAVIAVESSFNPKAVSCKGARGLMQVMPVAHPEKVRTVGGEEMLHEVETGIQVGARILREYQMRSGNLRAALQRYSGAAAQYEEKVLARKREFDRFAGILQAEVNGEDLLKSLATLLQPLDDVLSEIVARWYAPTPDT